MAVGGSVWRIRDGLSSVEVCAGPVRRAGCWGGLGSGSWCGLAGNSFPQVPGQPEPGEFGLESLPFGAVADGFRPQAERAEAA